MSNLITPGTFEGGMESWFAIGAEVEQTTTKAHGGTHALAVRGKAVGGFEGAGKDVTLEAGKLYTFKVWAWRESGKRVRLFAQKEGATDIHELTFTSGATGWAEYKMEFIAGSSGTYEVSVRLAESTLATMYVDDVSLEPPAEEAKPTVKLKKEGVGTSPVPIMDGSVSSGNKGAFELEQAPPVEHSPPAEPGTRIKVVDATELFPGLGYEKCLLFEYVEGDAEVPANAGKRAELQPYNEYRYPNRHYWWKGALLVDAVPTTFPYSVIRQLHEAEPPTGVGAGLYLEGGRIKLKSGVSSAWWSKVYALHTVYDLKIHFYIAEKAGLVEVWLNGEKQTLENGLKIYENLNTLSSASLAAGAEPAKKLYEKAGINESRSTTGGTTRIYWAGLKTFEGPIDPDTATPGEWVDAERFVRSGGVWVPA